jgi:ABC-2 type transport system ATP-binding protein
MGMLDFDEVTERFASVTALEGCTCCAPRGRLTGSLGPNSAGNAMAMRAVFGLVALDAGTVRWHGHPISAAERARFGYMPEERGLYPRMRVREQLVCLADSSPTTNTPGFWGPQPSPEAEGRCWQ